MGKNVEWAEVRCQRQRNDQTCNTLLGYMAILDGYAAYRCRKCNAWTIIGSASFLPESLPEVRYAESSGEQRERGPSRPN